MFEKTQVNSCLILCNKVHRNLTNKYDGMANMVHRTTFSLDELTIRRLKNLAARWQISQAEVVRRALVQAEKQPVIAENSHPIDMLKALHRSGQGLSQAKADAYLAEVYEDRKHWRGA